MIRSYLVTVHKREHTKDQRAPGTLSSQEPQKHCGGGIQGAENGRVESRNVLRAQIGSAYYSPEKQAEVKWNPRVLPKRGALSSRSLTGCVPVHERQCCSRFVTNNSGGIMWKLSAVAVVSNCPGFESQLCSFHLTPWVWVSSTKNAENDSLTTHGR